MVSSSKASKVRIEFEEHTGMTTIEENIYSCGIRVTRDLRSDYRLAYDAAVNSKVAPVVQHLHPLQNRVSYNPLRHT
jgi:hypothetical protein